MSNSVCRRLARGLRLPWSAHGQYPGLIIDVRRVYRGVFGGDRYEPGSRRTIPATDLENFIGAVEERDHFAVEEIYYHTGNATMRVIGNGMDILIEAQQNVIRAG